MTTADSYISIHNWRVVVKEVIPALKEEVCLVLIGTNFEIVKVS